MLTFDLDLEIKDYAGDTAQQVAQTYNQQECLEVIAEHLRKQADRSKSSPNTRRGSTEMRCGSKSSPRRGSTEGKSGSTTATIKPASSPGVSRNFLDVKQPSDFDDVHFANPDIQLPKDTPAS